MERMGAWCRRQVKVGSRHTDNVRIRISEGRDIRPVTCQVSRRTCVGACCYPVALSVDNLGLIVQYPAPGLTTSRGQFFCDPGPGVGAGV